MTFVPAFHYFVAAVTGFGVYGVIIAENHQKIRIRLNINTLSIHRGHRSMGRAQQ
jgi:hypothetical protein